MISASIRIFILCGVVFVAILAVAAAVPFDDSLPPDRDQAIHRKQGDMAVNWYGVSAVRHGRLGSVGNRSYRGGGLHGGK